jgi:hypothetical protein
MKRVTGRQKEAFNAEDAEIAEGLNSLLKNSVQLPQRLKASLILVAVTASLKDALIRTGVFQQTVKPALISENSRGPEGPLFHGCAHICEFFRDL